MSNRGPIPGLPILILAALVFRPVTVHAAPAPGVANTAALASERARLRGELDRVSAEIDALKETTRGVGNDYRLRARLADAEALARRLTEIEARLGLRAPAGKPVPLPVAAPTDGPADLDAKADILTDQSRRVRGEADALGRRVAEIKQRQELRRRVADLERDPFAPLEGSKRRVASIATTSAVPAPGQTSASAASPTLGTPIVGTTPSLGGSTPASTTATTATAPPPQPEASSPLAHDAEPAAAALSVEVRDLLDPATIADIRRLEGTRTPTGTVRALERTVAALRAQADALDVAARAMRASAGQK